MGDMNLGQDKIISSMTSICPVSLSVLILYFPVDLSNRSPLKNLIPIQNFFKAKINTYSKS